MARAASADPDTFDPEPTSDDQFCCDAQWRGRSPMM
jgi:hypothetical protein